MNSDLEIRRLLDMMPASARMSIKLRNKPQQSQVINAPFPLPWQRKEIFINFDLWFRLSTIQRDLILLSMVNWLNNIKWFKPNLYQGITVVGFLGTMVELSQGDAVGVIVAGGLTALSTTQIWRINHRTEAWLEADKLALQVGQRRGYTQVDGAEALLSGIKAIAEIEGRESLNFIELIRSQNLRSIAGLSTPSSSPEIND